MARILLLGLDPEAVDYSGPALPPGMNAEKVRAGIAVAVKQFTDTAASECRCVRQLSAPSPVRATCSQLSPTRAPGCSEVAA